ncbi:MAG TPA: adenosylhomocysteinase [Candidatus Aenigmarchaeota archaeon]|nr:MAG: adenosylhomocysteinase [Candidatus Aenigmarchaeota archaeon]HDD46109.1 adenosylhomocysteinase [Candidatus Aenigmarchaeota archaeon]
MSKIACIDLAEKGKLKLEWAERHMPVLMQIRKRFKKEKPLSGKKIACCLHVTKETGALVRTLAEGGAKVFVTASNPLSTQDDVAAALVKNGIEVFAWRGNHEKYYWCIDQVLNAGPHILMDDGADLITRVHTKRKELASNIIGGTEETTTGVTRFKVMEKDNKLLFPVIAVNDAYTKYLFDNRYGTGQSTIDGILRATNVLIAGKTFVVAGYGWCSRGIAMRARGMGANVIVTEVDPLRALEAVMDGFRVMPMSEAAKYGDIFVTATGDKDVIRGEHFKAMKNNVILANAGHFNVEISIKDLEGMAKSKKTIRENVEEYTLGDGKRLYLLAEGRLVNLACAEGHPSEVMDMSFANQALCTEYLVKNGMHMQAKVYRVPGEIDNKVAKLKLKSMGISIDKLTEEQKRYLNEWKEGT